MCGDYQAEHIIISCFYHLAIGFTSNAPAGYRLRAVPIFFDGATDDIVAREITVWVNGDHQPIIGSERTDDMQRRKIMRLCMF